MYVKSESQVLKSFKIAYLLTKYNVELDHFKCKYLWIMAWQVIQMHIFGYFLVFVVPSVLATMNLMWFAKILKGLKKQLAKRQ